MLTGRCATTACWARSHRRQSLPPRRQLELNGHTHHRAFATGRARFRRPGTACLHLMVARNRTLLPAEGSRGRCAGLASGVLARHWFRIWYLFPLRQRAWPATLSRLFLSWRAHHDCALHLHLHHDVGDRRPERRLPALGVGSPGTALGDRVGKGPGRHNPRNRSGNDFLDLRPFRGSAPLTVSSCPGRDSGVPGFFCADGSGLLNRLAHGLYAGLSRHCQLVSDTSVAVVWRAVSAGGCLGLDPRPHAIESTDLWRGGVARTTLP